MLSRRTKYGIKALVFLARTEDNSCTRVAEIAEKENIPYKFLETILLDLKKAGFLGSKKGRSGGYYLLKATEDIRMTDVIRILEGPIAMVSCVSLNFYEKCEDCPEEDTCSVRNLMIDVRDQTLNVLGSNTLADMI